MPAASVPQGRRHALATAGEPASAAPRAVRPVRAWVVSGLVLLSLALFRPVLDHDFVALDDDVYVTENRHVRAGLTREGFAWAFTSFGYQGNWHPLTWLSHMLDVELFGTNPRGHHATSLLLHAANTALLFLLLHGLTGTLWPSAFAAALFCVHPLHVETVAWVSDRKGALSTLFWLLATGAWLRHLRAPGAARYLWAVLFFCAGLLAKPMLVTLPLTLLLLDFWPLGRTGAPARGAAARGRHRRLVLEKAPLLVLALLSGPATYAAQQRAGAMAFSGLQHGWVRVADAFVSSAGYLEKLVWPVDLSVFYPLPRVYFTPGKIATAAALVLGLSVAAALLRRRAPAAAAGWCWFLVTLLPVSGLVQVGSQAMADRYTYVPLIGLFVAAAWGTPRLLPPRAGHSRLLPVAAALALALLIGPTRERLGHWRDSETLLGNALALAPESWMLHTNLGKFLLGQGRAEEAIAHFGAALRANPNDLQASYNLGIALNGLGRLEEAAAALRRAVRINPAFSEGYNNLGAVLYRQGNVREAHACFVEAVRLGPGNRQALANLALAEQRLREAGEQGAR